MKNQKLPNPPAPKPGPCRTARAIGARAVTTAVRLGRWLWQPLPAIAISLIAMIIAICMALIDYRAALAISAIAVLAAIRFVWYCYTKVEQYAYYSPPRFLLNVVVRLLGTRVEGSKEMDEAVRARFRKWQFHTPASQSENAHHYSANVRKVALALMRAIAQTAKRTLFHFQRGANCPEDGSSLLYDPIDLTPNQGDCGEDSIIAMVDVDHFVDMNIIMERVKPILIYGVLPTHIPEPGLGHVTWFERDELHWEAHQGYVTHHQIWDYGADYVTSYGWCSATLFKVRRYACPMGRVVTALIPEWHWGWFGFLARLFHRHALRRHKFCHKGTKNDWTAFRWFDSSGQLMVTVAANGPDSSGVTMEYAKFSKLLDSQRTFQQARTPEHTVIKYLGDGNTIMGAYAADYIAFKHVLDTLHRGKGYNVMSPADKQVAPDGSDGSPPGPAPMVTPQAPAQQAQPAPNAAPKPATVLPIGGSPQTQAQRPATESGDIGRKKLQVVRPQPLPPRTVTAMPVPIREMEPSAPPASEDEMLDALFFEAKVPRAIRRREVKAPAALSIQRPRAAQEEGEPLPRAAPPGESKLRSFVRGDQRVGPARAPIKPKPTIINLSLANAPKRQAPHDEPLPAPQQPKAPTAPPIELNEIVVQPMRPNTPIPQRKSYGTFVVQEPTELLIEATGESARPPHPPVANKRWVRPTRHPAKALARLNYPPRIVYGPPVRPAGVRALVNVTCECGLHYIGSKTTPRSTPCEVEHYLIGGHDTEGPEKTTLTTVARSVQAAGEPTRTFIPTRTRAMGALCQLERVTKVQQAARARVDHNITNQFDAFITSLMAQLGEIPDPNPDWLDEIRPKYQEAMREAHDQEFCCDVPEACVEMRTARGFMKAEPYQEPKDPRAITPLHPKVQSRMYKYTQSLQHAMHKCRWFAFGAGPNAVAQHIADMSTEPVPGTCAIEVDFRRYDGSITPEMRDLELKIYKAAFPSHARDIENWHRLTYNLSVKVAGQITDSGTSRASGAPDTCLMNTLINAFHAWTVMGECFWRAGVVGGDDGLFFWPASPDIWTEAGRRCGLEPKVKRRPIGSTFTFLARTYTWGSPNSICDVQRTLSKVHLLPEPNIPPKYHRQRFLEKLDSLLLMDGNTPLVGTVLRQAREIAVTMNWPVKQAEKKDREQTWLEKWLSQSDYPNKEEEWMHDAVSTVACVLPATWDRFGRMTGWPQVHFIAPEEEGGGVTTVTSAYELERRMASEARTTSHAGGPLDA